MTSAADAPVESGQQYSITKVDGTAPTDLADFDGTISLTLTKDGHNLEVHGCASEVSGLVRFHQKQSELHDRDVRVWIITQEYGRFIAEPAAAF